MSSKGFINQTGITNMDLKKHLTRDNVIYLIIIAIMMAFFIFMAVINYL